MRILAIDPSSTTLGWAILDGPGDKLVACGEVSTKTVEYGRRFQFILDSLTQMYDTFKPDQVACEEAVRWKGRKIAALEVAVKTIEKWAKQRRLPFALYKPSTWKRSVLGKAGADKQAAKWLVAAMFEPIGSDHIADAVCIGLHHLGVLKYETMAQAREV